MICFIWDADDSATDDLLFGSPLDGWTIFVQQKTPPTRPAVDNLSDPLGRVTRLGNNALPDPKLSAKKTRLQLERESSLFISCSSAHSDVDGALLRVSLFAVCNFSQTAAAAEPGDFQPTFSLSLSAKQSNIENKGCA